LENKTATSTVTKVQQGSFNNSTMARLAQG